MQWFGAESSRKVIPGSTAISVSREVLAELKGKGETQLSFRIGGLKGMAGSLLGALGQMAGGGAGGAHPKKTKDLADMGKAECTMKRVGDALTAFSGAAQQPAGFPFRRFTRNAPPTTA